MPRRTIRCCARHSCRDAFLEHMRAAVAAEQRLDGDVGRAVVAVAEGRPQVIEFAEMLKVSYSTTTGVQNRGRESVGCRCWGQ